MNKYLLSITLFGLTACTFTHPVKGVVENKEHERFLGTATASLLEANATIDITTDTGAHCSGTYPRPQGSGGGVTASGGFTCTDGRTGIFAFGGTAHGGEGFGKFNTGQKFTFVYGDSSSPEDRAAAALALQSLGQSMQNINPPSPTMYMRPPINCSSSTFYGSTTTNCN
jgi:hypothetical protein